MHNNSDQVKEIFNLTNNNSGGDQPSTGDAAKRTDPKHNETNRATPAAHTQPSGIMGNTAPTPAAVTPAEGSVRDSASAVKPADLQSSASSAGAHAPSQTSNTGPASASHTPSPTASASPASASNTPRDAGTHMRRMQDPDCKAELEKTLLRDGHTALVEMEWLKKGLIVPSEGRHVWDGDHVKLPHTYPRPTSHTAPSRWEVTRQALERLGSGSFSARDVQDAILSYNSSYRDQWSFDVLYYYGTHVRELDDTLALLIPRMTKLALELPALVKRSVPLLRRQQARALSLSQQQISSLLANAFFCTFPHRNSTRAGSEYASFPSINFSSLFRSKTQEKQKLKAEKLRAIFHYFDTVTKSPESENGLVTFERICVPHSKLPDWNKQKQTLCGLQVSADGSIESEGTGMLQVDFASRFVGGGVLQSGLVQEEILFLMCPELIVARLFTEKLEHNECLRITGPQMFSVTQGYSRSFSWAGPHHDRTPRDAWKRRYRQIVAIDALDFKNPHDQYSKENITRELNKAFVGFSGLPKTAIATGNWGCGAFRGDPQLKAVIQLMAAAVAGRDVTFFTFRNRQQACDLQELHESLRRHRVSVDQLYKLLNEFCKHCERQTHRDLFRFLREKTGRSSSSL